MTVYRIMIVDDDEFVRRLLRTTLPSDGFEIVEARDGDQALELLAETVPDLVLLDWRMPGRPGQEVLDEVRRLHPRLPVIVLTAETKPLERALAESLGANAFLTKPFSPLELLETVERLLAEPA
jgi:CheY-like chemotaxis protein